MIFPPVSMNHLYVHLLPSLSCGPLWLASTSLNHYCTSHLRPDRPITPAHIAVRMFAAAKGRMCRDWLLVGSDIRLQAWLLSHRLRGN